VVLVMAGVMAVSFVMAALWLPRGRVEEPTGEARAPGEPEPAGAGSAPAA
jgi:hypothetical protein